MAAYALAKQLPYSKFNQKDLFYNNTEPPLADSYTH